MIDLLPYEKNSIYRGECAKLMAKMPSDCIDLTVTSPPYDNLRDYNGYEFDYKKVLAGLYRVTKPGGVVVWVVADATIKGSETGTSFRHALYAMDVCGFSMETMIYDSGHQGSKGSNNLYSQSFEFMFVFVKGKKPLRGSLIRDHKNRYGGTKNTSTRRRKNGVRRVERFNIPEYSKRVNIWSFPNGQGGSGDKLCHDHPAPFPESLARDHILSWSNPGDLAFDPMCGSGTTLKMAMQNGRDYLGFDMSEEYCELSRQRVAWANPPLLVVG